MTSESTVTKPLGTKHDAKPTEPQPAELNDAASSGNGRLNAGELSAALLELLHTAAEREASDLHIVPGYPPTLRIHGRLEPAGDAALSADQVAGMLAGLALDDPGGPRWREQPIDCSISIAHKSTTCRFRASLYSAQGQLCACLRHIPNRIPTFEWLGFDPQLAEKLVSATNGLVIVTGVTGSGKTSTLAALLDFLRKRGDRHILTVEEPIEFVHQPGAGGIITQREVGRDVRSFADGLKYGLRQDPDVILVGEIRDRETAQMAISAAETGHLIFTTLHTRDAKGALTRLIDLFGAENQEDLRKQLAMSLRAVVAQHLLPPAEGSEKRVLAVEVLFANIQVQTAIRTGKIESIDSAIQTGKRDGMIPLDHDLQRLAHENKIPVETARQFAKDPTNLGGERRAW